MITDFIEFQTYECVSDDKEINRSIQNRVQMLLLLFPDVSKIYSIVTDDGVDPAPTDDGVDLRNVWEQQQQHLYSILYRPVNLFVIWDALVSLKFNKV